MLAKTIHRRKLDWDHDYNPRYEEPSRQLKRNVHRRGVTDELIVRKVDDDYYLIGDGWQRYLAGVEAGIVFFDCEVYTDMEEYASTVFSQNIATERATSDVER